MGQITEEMKMDAFRRGFAAGAESHEDLVGLPLENLKLRAPMATHQHFKGGLYRYLGPLMDCETREQALDSKGRPLVAYMHLYPHEVQIWQRSEEEFFGQHESGVPRFKELK